MSYWSKLAGQILGPNSLIKAAGQEKCPVVAARSVQADNITGTPIGVRSVSVLRRQQQVQIGLHREMVRLALIAYLGPDALL